MACGLRRSRRLRVRGRCRRVAGTCGTQSCSAVAARAVLLTRARMTPVLFTCIQQIVSSTHVRLRRWFSQFRMDRQHSGRHCGLILRADKPLASRLTLDPSCEKTRSLGSRVRIEVDSSDCTCRAPLLYGPRLVDSRQSLWTGRKLTARGQAHRLVAPAPIWRPHLSLDDSSGFGVANERALRADGTFPVVFVPCFWLART